MVIKGWTCSRLRFYFKIFFDFYLFDCTGSYLWHMESSFSMWDLFFFFSCCIQTLFHWPRIEPWPPTLGVWSLNHWTIKEVPQSRLSDTEKYISQTERFVPNSNQNKHISTGFQSFFFPPKNQISNRKLCSLFYSLINMVHDTAWACAWILNQRIDS